MLTNINVEQELCSLHTQGGLIFILVQQPGITNLILLHTALQKFPWKRLQIVLDKQFYFCFQLMTASLWYICIPYI